MLLQEQLAEWDWNPLMDAAFQHHKTWICQTLLNTTIMYYDRYKPGIVQTDASKYRLGTALIQSGYPTTFASKMLTDVKNYYANIEKECLSEFFNLEKFHTNLYSRDVTL